MISNSADYVNFMGGVNSIYKCNDIEEHKEKCFI